MNLIAKFFGILNKYNIVVRDCDDILEVIDKINKVKIKKKDSADKNAVIILGYSGNGKQLMLKKS